MPPVPPPSDFNGERVDTSRGWSPWRPLAVAVALVAILALGLGVALRAWHAPGTPTRPSSGTSGPAPARKLSFYRSSLLAPTDLDLFRSYVLEVEATSFYSKWSAQNPGERARWQGYRDAVLAGVPATPPVMQTHFGTALVLAAQMAVAEVVTIPAPTTTSTSSTSTSTTATTTTTTTTPAAVRHYGFSTGAGPDTVTSYDAATRARYFDLIRANGGTLVRMDCWTVDAPLVTRVQEAVARGLTVMLTVMHQSLTQDGYAQLAGACAAKFRPLGVREYETGNEPNLTGFWAGLGGVVNPNVFRLRSNAAYDAIKAAAPDARVTLGGLSSFGQYHSENTLGLSELDFLERMYASGPVKMDALGDHPYFYGDNLAAEAMLSHASVWSGWAHLFWSTPSLRSVMVSHGDGGKPIDVTEWGAPTDGGAYSGGTSEAEQARLITLGIAEWKAQGSAAGELAVYSFRDRPVDDLNREGHFGVVRYDWTGKPALAAFAAAAAP